MKKFLIAGSPCTHWSIAQSKNRETTAEGIGWELFRNYLAAKEKFKPDFFLCENNKSAAQVIKNQISTELGAPLQYINSALVSAQNRQRFYCHNFGDVPQPEDRGILLRDVLISGIGWQDKSFAYTTRCNGAIPEDTLRKRRHTMVAEPACNKAFCIAQRGRYTGDGGKVQQNFEPRFDGKTSSLTTIEKDNNVCMPIGQAKSKERPIYRVEKGRIEIKGIPYPIKLPDGYYVIRKLYVAEACRLQTLPDNYCRAVSDTQAYKGLGNGWTAEVIIHLLRHAPVNVGKDEEIVVLSMYDGIGTGRYCFDALGYNNVKYYAYEIDKHAMQIALSNYPDIIQCGDAFQLCENNWSLPGTEYERLEAL